MAGVFEVTVAVAVVVAAGAMAGDLAGVLAVTFGGVRTFAGSTFAI